jgi:hypothetical protein
VQPQLVPRLHRLAQRLQPLRAASSRPMAGAYRASASAETRAAGGSTDRILPSPLSMSRASAGSTQLCASRAAATSALASSCVNISGGSSKPAPSR